jgi:predicted DNA-binding protein (MmcQ/YjbR family)
MKRGRSMDRDAVLSLCLAQPGAVEDYPFGDDVAVFKVAGKMFALVALREDVGRVTLKCDPTHALELRARWAAVSPGYHTNKRHWNTVTLDDTVPASDLAEMITHSYDEVVAKLTRAERAALTSS